MNILHCYDVAGVGCVIAKYQRKLGHNSEVIGKSNLDPFGFLHFYHEKGITDETESFVDQVDRMSEDFDIIHLHALPELVNHFRLRGKKVIMHFHGNDVIHTSDISGAHAVILSSENLQKYVPNGIVIKNPVDTDHFRPILNSKREGAVTFAIRYNDVEKLKAHYGKPLKIIDRDEKHIPYSDMPEFLSYYNTYVDIKFDTCFENGILKAMSKTGLESLACGLEVVNWELKTLKGLPVECEPLNVAKQVIELYE